MLIVALLLLGFGGIVAQTLLLREMLILFSGNELSLCLVISSWVVSEGLGAFVAGIWAGRKRIDVKIFTWATLLFSAAFPASIYASRVFKSLAGIPAEMALGLTTVLYASFGLLLPTGFLHGFLFSLACGLYARSGADTRSPAGTVYLYETLGTIAGGLTVSYLFIPHLQAFQIGFGLCLINGVCCLLLLRHFHAGKATLACAVTATLFVALPILVLINGADALHVSSIKKVFAGQNLIYYENSFYQNIAVVKTEDQYTFFTDGLPAVTTPVPDIVSVEEFVHFSLPAHPSPEKILFLGGGAGGAIHEALKYPSVTQIDYVELDPAMLQTIRRFQTPLTESELTDYRVKLHYVDGRRFIRETDSRYDVVLLSMPSPSTLQKNRFFTEESFMLVRRILKQGGIFVLTLPGSLAYYSLELKAINASVLLSLSAVFPWHYVVPGDTNIFLASISPDIARVTPELLHERLKAAQVSTNLVTYAHLADRFQQRRRDWFLAALDNVEALSNRDFRPSGVFYEIAYENLMLAPSMKPLFAWAQRVTFPAAALCVILLFCAVLLIGRRWARVSLTFAVATTGFAGMVIELMLIFGFQVVYGYVFYEIALLITAFMAGIAAGSLFIARCLRETRPTLSMFFSIEAGLILFTLLLMFLLSLLDTRFVSRPLVLHLLFLLLLFASGIFIGMEFPLATGIYQSSHTLERSVGLLYAADLAGGCVGGLFTGILLFPLLGLFSTCLLLALVKACSLTFLLLQRKRGIMID
jgi:spermidine synthase